MINGTAKMPSEYKNIISVQRSLLFMNLYESIDVGDGSWRSIWNVVDRFFTQKKSPTEGEKSAT